MKGKVLKAAVLAAAVAAPLGTVSGQSAAARADSAAIVRAVWDTVASGFGAPHARLALWLWAPAADSVGVVPLSPALRDSLVRQGIPAFVRWPVGDDTVVFRLTGWRTDSAGVSVELMSGWTTVLGFGRRRCRTGSGNHERFRLERRDTAWVAERVGPIVHGDRVCTPIR